MKRYFAIRLLSFSVLAFLTVEAIVAQELGKPANTNIRNAKYPRVLPNNRVVFNIKAPNAQTVQVDLGKKYDMLKDANGVWSVTTDSISEGFHYYTLLIDGVSVADPSSKAVYGMSRMASGIEIPFAGGDYYALKKVPHGDVRIQKYFSSVTNSWRQMYIYTPPEYEQNVGVKYPVLYILHGGGEDETGWTNQGKADLILDNLIVEKKAKPMILVMPDANLGAGGFSAGGIESSMKMFEDEMKQVIIPLIESKYRVKTDAKDRALAGLSFGGMHTLYTGLKNMDLFSSLGVFSSGWIVPMMSDIADERYAVMKTDPDKINKGLKVFFITQGGPQDIAYKNGEIMMDRLKELKINYKYEEYPGGHTWPVWRNNLFKFSQLLFK